MKKIIFILTVLLSEYAFSESERMGQARLFLGSTQTSPSELNTELTAQGLKNVELNNQFGLEITFPLLAYFNGGLRYSKMVIGLDEKTSDTSTQYEAGVNQEVFDFVGRVPFFRSNLIIVDGVVGVGGSNTKYNIKTATQDGELEKKGTPFATPHALAGVSVAIGWEKYFFVVESGYNMNKIDDFTKSGTINDNVKSMDLSGAYVTIGLLFNGIPIFYK